MKVINTKYHWIQNDINLDFEDRFQHALVHEIAEAERNDLDNNKGDYYGNTEAIDMLGKQLYAAGKITEAQWDKLCEKYPEP